MYLYSLIIHYNSSYLYVVFIVFQFEHPPMTIHHSLGESGCLDWQIHPRQRPDVTFLLVVTMHILDILHMNSLYMCMYILYTSEPPMRAVHSTAVEHERY